MILYVLKQGERCKTHIHLGQAMGKGNFEKLMQILTEWCKTKSKIIMTAANQNKIKLNTKEAPYTGNYE